MDKTHEDIQADYIAALKNDIPIVLDWWHSNCPYPPTKPVSWDDMNDFHRRWPFGPAAHPRIVARFREYYFQVEALNESIAQSPAEQAEAPRWGEDVPPPERKVVRPVDLLINDLYNLEPDLYDVMQGFLYIPIGMDPDGEEC